MEEGSSHKALFLFLIAFVLFIVVVGVVGLSFKPKTSSSQVVIPTPSKNPASETANPFKQDSTYQNPFASTASADKQYKNPFEQLR